MIYPGVPVPKGSPLQRCSGRAPGPPVAQCRAGGARAWPALGGGFGAATAAARGEQ